VKMTPDFYRMAMSGLAFTVRDWAYALEAPQYQFNSALRFSALTGVPYHRIKETPRELNKTPRRPRTGDGGAVRGQ